MSTAKAMKFRTYGVLDAYKMCARTFRAYVSPYNYSGPSISREAALEIMKLYILGFNAACHELGV